MSSHLRRFLPLAALAVAMAGVAIAAPQAANDAKIAKTAAAHPGHHGTMMKLDANNDGSIDRAEAAAHPRMAAAFAKFDKNGDGKLDATERPARHEGHEGRGHRGGKGAHRGGGHGAMSHAIKLDTDGDGRISTIEAKDSRLAERFASIDRNRDGFLVRAELQADAEQRRTEHKAQRMQRFETRFAAADGNRDGKLSRAEVEASMPRHGKAFAFMDGDRDGFLTRGELQPAPRH